MKKTFKTMLALMAGAMVFAACSNDDTLENINEQTPSALKPMIFTVSMEGQGGGTRAAIDGLDIKWTSGDKISIFDGEADEDGNFAREFVLTGGVGSTAGTFEGKAATATTYYALYPYAASSFESKDVTEEDARAAAGKYSNQLDMWKDFIEMEDEEMVIGMMRKHEISPENQAIILAYLKGEKIEKKSGVQRNASNQFEDVVLPAEQTATAGSADPKAMLMIGESDDAYSLQFKNVCAYVKVTPQFDCTAIKLISKGPENLAGTVTLDYNGGTPIASVTANGSNNVSITGDIKAGETYYIAVLPATLSDGFTLSFKTSSDGSYEKNTEKTLALTRNKVINLGSFIKDNLTKATIAGTAEAAEKNVPWVQLWEDGPKWAVYNVGVTNDKPESYGGYYAWGGSVNISDDHYTGASALSGNTDTATKLWGSKWRMPRKEELEALLTQCNVEWTTSEGVAGCKFTGKGDFSSNSIFMPYAGDYVTSTSTATAGQRLLYVEGSVGFYWSSTPTGGKAYAMQIYSNGYQVTGYTRDYGYSVRAVLK